MSNIFSNKKILVVASHPDDEILGAGGTIHKCSTHLSSEAKAIILSKGVASRLNKDNETLQEEIKRNEHDIKRATSIVGFKEVEVFDLPDNEFDTVSLLSVVKIIEQQINSFEPDMILTHHNYDLNVDHRITSQAVMTASRPIDNNLQIVSFETPSSTEWQFPDNHLSFNPNLFIKLEKDSIEAKMDAIDAYTGEVRDYPHPRSPLALEVIAKRWGTVIGSPFAEAFRVHRLIF
jgi:LmbE family N-acetylglucosaminyl deacetylase